jgi:hypothetical protein
VEGVLHTPIARLETRIDQHDIGHVHNSANVFLSTE